MLQLQPNPPNLRLPLDWQLEAALKMGFEFDRIGWRESDCKTCRGTKTVRTWEGTPLKSEVVEFPCNCVEQVVLSRYLGMRGIPVDLRRRGFADTYWIKKDVREHLKEWTQDPADLARRETGVIITGASKGKSLVASLLQRLMLLNDVDAYMISMQMFTPDGALANWKSESYEEIQEFWLKVISVAPVLIIDRLEGGAGRITDWGRGRIDALIEQRRSNEKMTIITTGSPDLMITALSDHTRATEGFTEIDMKADQYPLAEILAQERTKKIIRPIVMGGGDGPAV